MINNIDLLNKVSCTGCGMCADLCPKKAIEMTLDTEGFKIPRVDRGLCVECGICADMCPQLCDDVAFESVKHSYAVICSDEIRGNCSSGGVFGAVGKWALANGGVVFGAAFGNDVGAVLHKKARTEEELLDLCKSKYLQSDTWGIFSEAAKALDETDKPVVFCGCPCQVSALKKYIGKDRDNLFLIDILCHGVVSPMAYKKFLEEQTENIGGSLKSVAFRSKAMGWSCNVLLEADDGAKYANSCLQDYFKAFLWGYSQRNACFNCKYARPERVGDITIGDFWGIERLSPEMNDKKGTSLVLCNTEKGNKLIDEIKKDISKIEEYDYRDILDAVSDVNWAMVKPGIKPENRDVFFYRLSRGDRFSQAFRYASTDKFDVGIYGWWYENEWTNYGSTLTYYALMEYTSSLGLSVCMIRSPYQKTAELSDFVRKHGYRISKNYSVNDIKKHNEYIDAFLLGSDQLWFYHCFKNWGYSLFLDFVNDDKKKISYATSFGHKDPRIPDSEIPKLNDLMQKLDAVSARETDGVGILKNKFGVNAAQCVDPVFLCDIRKWEKIADEAERKTDGDFIFTYMLDPTPEKIKALDHISRKLKLPAVSITDRQYSRNEKENMLKKHGVLTDPTVAELVYHLKNARYVLTDSYHGTCFSLIFRRSFAAIMNPTRGLSRFETLSELFSVGNRFVLDPNELISDDSYLDKPDYSVISPKVERETARSKAWLADKLLNKKTRKKDPPITETQKKIMDELHILSSMGYSIGKYLSDSGIDRVSVYCAEKYINLFESFFVSLTFDGCVTVDGYYSDRSFRFKYAQEKIFGTADFKRGMPTQGILLYISDKIEPIKAPGCTVMSMLRLQWGALAYAIEYRPLLYFKKIHPNVNIAAVKFPLCPPRDKMDKREIIITDNPRDYDYENMLNKLPETFSVFGDKYSHEEWCELFGDLSPETGIDGKIKYADYSGRLKNIKQGHRVTAYQMQDFKKSVFMIGGSKIFGYGCADSETSSSYLQQLINAENLNIRAENYGAFLNYRKKDMYRFLFDIPVRDGDIVIVDVWAAAPSFCNGYIDSLDLSELFYRPHDHGEVFVDAYHYSHLGQKAIAEEIFEFLRDRDFYEKGESKTVEADIDPRLLWGIPEINNTVGTNTENGS